MESGQATMYTKQPFNKRVITLDSSTHTQSNTELAQFLNNQRTSIVEKWLENVLLPQNDPFYEEVKKNGHQTIVELINFLETGSLDRLQALTSKIAKERIEAKANVGDFVHNINVGRSIVYELLMCSLLNDQLKGDGVLKMQRYFDQLVFLSVQEYTALKDSIIDRKNQFIQEMHHDRLTMLGQIAASFAHEFRNPLTSIQGFIQLLKADHPEMKYLDIIKNELDQLNFRISQFLLLSKKELIGKEKTRFSINQMIDEVLNFLYPSILDTKVKIIKETPEEMELVGYADEIRQVLINIVFNAIDVLSQYREDPKIEIRAYTVNQAHIKLEIANNGPAIPENMLKSIFEPFVTTKKLGTGMGLFVSREIIEKHKGFLACSSIQDRTEFIIFLPLANKNP